MAWLLVQFGDSWIVNYGQVQIIYYSTELLVILKYSNSPLQSVDSVITAGNWYQCSIAQLPLLCKSIRVYVYT